MENQFMDDFGFAELTPFAKHRFVLHENGAG